MDNIIINHWAVLTAALSDFIIGALWYSPLMFYKSWLDANKLTEEALSKMNKPLSFFLTFVLTVIISYNLAFFLGGPETDAMWGLSAGILVGLGWAGTGFTIIAVFELRSLKYILINCGYLFVAFAMKGFIIGLWR